MVKTRPDGRADAVTVRPVCHADLEPVVMLWRQVFPEYDDPLRPQRDSRSSILRKLDFDDGLFWLGQSGDSVVATVMAGYDGHRGWIYSLGVHPEFRRAGLGQTLVRQVESALGKLGCPKINLQVLVTNEGALAFWRALGYEPDSVQSLGKRL